MRPFLFGEKLIALSAGLTTSLLDSYRDHLPTQRLAASPILTPAQATAPLSTQRYSWHGLVVKERERERERTKHENERPLAHLAPNVTLRRNQPPQRPHTTAENDGKFNSRTHARRCASQNRHKTLLRFDVILRDFPFQIPRNFLSQSHLIIWPAKETKRNDGG